MRCNGRYDGGVEFDDSDTTGVEIGSVVSDDSLCCFSGYRVLCL